MRYAVISDVHGNYPALQAVMEDAARQGITQFLFAGDYCISGPWPDECVAAIRAVPGKHVIRGNEEKYLENLAGKDQSLWTDGQMQVSYWCYRNISREHLEYLLDLPHTDDFECNGIGIHMAHSSVNFLGTYPFYTWNSVTVAERNRQAGADPERILEDMAAEREQDPAFLEAVSGLEKGVYIFGHSHIQCSYIDEEAGIYLVNPGSCGIPLDGIRGSVPYTVLEITEAGQVRILEKRVPFDKAGYIAALKQTGQFREANVWSRVIMRELATAKEHMYFFLKFTEQYAKDIGDERRPYAADTWEKAYMLWNRPEILKADRGTELADRLLAFAENCSWEGAGEHIAEMIRSWVFEDWETMFAAVMNGRIVGMASAMKTDYYPLPEVYPWVSCLFVSEEYRGQRISGELIDCANRYLKEQGFDRSYIPTEYTGLYEHYGYRYLRDIVNYGGGTDRLYVKEL